MKNYKINNLFLLLSLLLSVNACEVNSTEPSAIDNSVKEFELRDSKKRNLSEEFVFSREGWIYYQPASKKEPQKIAQGDFPSLNAQKKEVVFVKPQAPDAEPKAVLMLYDLATNKSREINRLTGFVSALRFAPEGDLVLFVRRTKEGKTNLEVLNTTGDEIFTINENNKEINDVFNPVWAADGNSIYFHDMVNLFRVSFDGQILKKISLFKFAGNLSQITSSDRFIPSLKDENLLLFTRLVPGTPLFEKIFNEPNTAIFLYDFKADKKARITPENMFAVDPTWSANGEDIYFTGYYDRSGRENYPFRIYRIKSDGLGLAEITKGENIDF